jgi:arabinofuranosyltransferase
MKKTNLSLFLIPLVILILIFHINYFRFVCDDAFISFRYAKNFIEGHGLVYNVGERVEGYTNFLWTILLSVFMGLGFNAVMVSQVLGGLFGLFTILLLLRFNQVLYPENSFFNYLAPLFLVCCGAYAAWSTGGLETSFYTFLVFSGSFLFITGMEKALYSALSGMVFALACLTRLDGLIFVGVTLVFYVSRLQRKKPFAWKLLCFWTLSFLIPFLVYFIWRWSYYGKFLPNTFYVKIGGEILYQQGLIYLFDFISRFWAWLYIIPIVFLYLAIKSNSKLRFIVHYFFILILLFSVYVIYVGGDFMDMFRFFVPVLPFLFFLIQEGFRTIYDYSLARRKEIQKRLILYSEVALTIICLFLLARPSRESNRSWSRAGIDSIGILRDSVRLWSRVGVMFKHIAKPGESLATTAAGAIPYYSELYTFDELGLTLASTAELKARNILRPGHWKEVTDEFLISQKPTYIVGHPKLYDEFKSAQGVWGFSQTLLEAGYKPIVFTVKVSDKENKYLYCLSLKKSYLDTTPNPSTLKDFR